MSESTIQLNRSLNQEFHFTTNILLMHLSYHTVPPCPPGVLSYHTVPPCPPGVLSYQNCLLVYRFFFPFVLSLLLCLTLLTFSVKQASRLYNHVRNEK